VAPRIALANGVLYLCHEGAIKQENGKVAFRLTVASESREPHVRIDSTGWIKASTAVSAERVGERGAQ
jgi:hypothetical protein